MEEQQLRHVQALPEDMLVDVLRCLAPRSLAVSRCVCKAWHAVIDGHRLLRAELLPHSMSGIFINFCMLALPEFFSCAGAGAATATTGHAAAVSGDLYSFAPKDIFVGHCNGLLLGFKSVVNPATRQWAPLPWLPPCAEKQPNYRYLAFDPAISPHYEVFLMPILPKCRRSVPRDDPVTRENSAEWPPSLCETLVFSSRTGRWEERSFARRGEPAGTMADMARADSAGRYHYSVYWHGALYLLHSQNNLFCRISLATNEYQVIKPPVKNGPGSRSECYLGRSKKGVYCAILDHRFQFRIWNLDESSSSSCHKMKWVLKHRNNNLKKALRSLDYSYQPVPDDGAWSFEDINYYCRFPEKKHRRSNPHEDGSDDDEEPSVEKPKITDDFYINILGFHPFKEIVYLSNMYSTGLAYHLDSSNVQYLGNMCPKQYGFISGHYAAMGALAEQMNKRGMQIVGQQRRRVLALHLGWIDVKSRAACSCSGTARNKGRQISGFVASALALHADAAIHAG